jgi:hypothetical protein
VEHDITRTVDKLETLLMPGRPPLVVVPLSLRRMIRLRVVINGVVSQSQHSPCLALEKGHSSTGWLPPLEIAVLTRSNLLAMCPSISVLSFLASIIKIVNLSSVRTSFFPHLCRFLVHTSLSCTTIFYLGCLPPHHPLLSSMWRTIKLRMWSR